MAPVVVVVVETAEVPVAVGTFVVVVVVIVLGGRPQQPMESRAVVGIAEAPVATPVAVATFVVVVDGLAESNDITMGPSLKLVLTTIDKISHKLTGIGRYSSRIA